MTIQLLVEFVQRNGLLTLFFFPHARGQTFN
ncbi:hypothetical protein NC651_002588 [Populus alba x Populus x berolinensis]|nr:hypothetical protein NC651_002588 [Populus alba x Populus x berolinensis]